MAQITQKGYKRAKEKLASINIQLDEAIKERAIAKEHADLSENAEYETACAKVSELTNKKATLESQLDGAEIVEADRGPRICIGSIIEVCRVDDSDKPAGPVRRFELDAHGCTITDGILGAGSPLGKAIMNGTDGIYKVASSGGIRYMVKKVRDEE